MRELVRLLQELQELELILEETRIVHGNTPPAQVEHTRERMKALRSSIPEDVLRRFDALRSGGSAVAAEINGVCSACRLTVPVGDLNRMHKGTAPWICPNCGRFLLLETDD